MNCSMMSEIKNPRAATIIIDAPEVRLKANDKYKPITVKTILNPHAYSIILNSDRAYFSAIYGGMVSKAITRIRPTT